MARTLLRDRTTLLSQRSIPSMLGMRRHDADMPVQGDGHTPGMVPPLFQRLADDPDMQSLAVDPRHRGCPVGTNDFAAGQDGGEPTTDSSLGVLEVMATLANSDKMPHDPEVEAHLPEGVLSELCTSNSSEAAVVGHGAALKDTGGDFTSHGNFHCVSDAGLAAALIQDHGVPPEPAQGPGFIGAQDELLQSTFEENSGSSRL